MLSRVIAKNVGDVFFETQCTCTFNDGAIILKVRGGDKLASGASEKFLTATMVNVGTRDIESLTG